MSRSEHLNVRHVYDDYQIKRVGAIRGNVNSISFNNNSDEDDDASQAVAPANYMQHEVENDVKCIAVLCFAFEPCIALLETSVKLRMLPSTTKCLNTMNFSPVFVRKSHEIFTRFR